MRFDLRLSISNLIPFHQIWIDVFHFLEKLFEAKQNRCPQSHHQKHEKDWINNQATDIEDLLFDFDKHNQLIIVHWYAEGKVDPPHHSALPRLSFHPSQLNNVKDIPSDEDTD